MTVLKYFSIEALLQNYTENLLQYNIIVQKGISYESMNNLCYKTNKKSIYWLFTFIHREKSKHWGDEPLKTLLFKPLPQCEILTYMLNSPLSFGWKNHGIRPHRAYLQVLEQLIIHLNKVYKALLYLAFTYLPILSGPTSPPASCTFTIQTATL